MQPKGEALSAARERHMKGPPPKLLAGVALLLGIVGLGCHWIWPTVAVIVTFVGVPLGFFVMLSFNYPAIQAVKIATGLLHGAAVYLMTSSPLLGAAASLTGLPAPYGWAVRRWADYSILQMPVLLLAALGLTAASAPIGLHTWPVAPAIAFLILLSVVAVQTIRQVSQYSKVEFSARVGEALDDVRLSSEGQETVWDLADERGQWVLLAFLRGDWCPLCHVQLCIYEQAKDLLERHGVKLVVIAAGFAVEHRREAGVSYQLLEDPDNQIAKRLGVVDPVYEENGQQFAVPFSVLIDAEGVVRYAPSAHALNTYVDPRDVIEVLGKLAEAPATA
jgi:peroxiredoxin